MVRAYADQTAQQRRYLQLNLSVTLEVCSGGITVTATLMEFVALTAPVTKNVDTTLAARYDEYSDFGGSAVPSIGVEYRPIEDLLIRGQFAQTFRAPDMQRVYGDPSYGSQQVTDPQGCQNAGGTPGPDSPISACNGEHYIDTITGPNPDLDAEQGES